MQSACTKGLIFFMNYDSVDFNFGHRRDLTVSSYIISENFYIKWSDQFFFIFLLHFFFIQDKNFFIILFDVRNKLIYPFVFKKNSQTMLKKNKFMFLGQNMFKEEPVICKCEKEINCFPDSMLLFETFYFILFLYKLISIGYAKGKICIFIVNLFNIECMYNNKWKKMIRTMKKSGIILDFCNISKKTNQNFHHIAYETKGIYYDLKKNLYETLIEKDIMNSIATFFFLSIYERQLYTLPLITNLSYDPKTNNMFSKKNLICLNCFCITTFFSFKCLICGQLFFFQDGRV
nr:hypothetical protein CparaKRNrm1_p111 [Cryptomonas paramecium]